MSTHAACVGSFMGPHLCLSITACARISRVESARGRVDLLSVGLTGRKLPCPAVAFAAPAAMRSWTAALR
eukprot:365508-Chlamydomonas_euryale.AAC.4